MKQLERIVSRGLSGPGPGYLDAVAGPTRNVVRPQYVVDRPDAEAVTNHEVDGAQSAAPRATRLEQLDREQGAVLVRHERIGQRACDGRPQLAVAIHPLPGDAVANVHEVGARRAEVLRLVAARRPRSRAGDQRREAGGARERRSGTMDAGVACGPLEHGLLQVKGSRRRQPDSSENGPRARP